VGIVAEKERNVRYTSGRVYGNQAKADAVLREKPRKGGGTYTETITSFPVGPDSEKKAAEYASELQRETRGMKTGGTVRGAGCERKGKTRGRFV
jgi:hypothetical protein